MQVILLQLVALAALVMANPMKRASIPPACFIDKIEQDNNYAWADLSSTCKAKSVGKDCCDTFVYDGAGTCAKPSDAKDVNNLKQALSQQVKKDGQFESSTVGAWSCSFALLTTAIPKRAVKDEWITGIENQVKKPAYTSAWGTINFSVDGNVIICLHNC